MSGLVALLSSRPDRAQLGRRALAYLRHVPSQNVAELDLPGVWLGAVGRPGSFAVAQVDDGKARAAIVCGALFGTARVARELGLRESVDSAALVLATYERWGIEGLARFDGAFAFAVVLREAGGQHVLTGGDSSGIMKVAAVDLGDDTMLATEAKAFLAHPSFRPALDQAAAVQVLALGYVLDGRPLFEGTRATSFCTFLDVRPGRMRSVRAWDQRDALGAATGEAYLESLRKAIVDVARDAFTDAGGVAADERGVSPIILPLTGGLDSRLLAAAAPPAARPDALTFGPGDDADSVLGGLVAQARGFPHVVLPLDENYLARTAAATVWLNEGRASPMLNITGFLMAQFADRAAFVSGQGGEIGRRTRKTHLLWPDQALLHADDAAFERRMADLVRDPSFALATRRQLLGSGTRKAVTGLDEELTRLLAETRGLHPVDRIDLYMTTHSVRELGGPTLAMPELYLAVRAPYLTRRWLGALLGGAPEERLDDLVRLRLISRVDPRAARVPWTMTHLPLPASAPLLMGLRGASGAAYHLLPRRRPRAETRTVHTVTWRARSLQQLKDRVYSHAERRNEWLRTGSRAFVEDLLTASSLAREGIIDAGVMSSLVAAQLAGEDHAGLIGQLVNLELWHKLFVEGDAALTSAVREQLATGAVRPIPAQDVRSASFAIP